VSTDYYFVCKPCKEAIQVASWGLGGFQFYRADTACMAALHKFLENHTIGEHDIRLLDEHTIYDDDYKDVDWQSAADGVKTKEK
jgi:hypothetical protein